MCKCFLGRRGAYWLSSSFGGAFVTKAFITLAPARQQDSSLVSALLSDLVSSHTNSQTQQTRRSQPPSHCLSQLVSLPPKETAIWFGYTRTAISGISTEKGLNSAMLFQDWLFDIPKCVIQMQPGSFQSNPRGYTGFANFSFTHSFYLYPPTLLLSPCVLRLQLTFSLLPFCLCISFPCVLAHELSVLPAIPIIVPCLEAENRGVKSELCRAWLFSISFSPAPHSLPVLFVKFWSITGVCVILVSFSHSDQYTDNRLMHCISWIGWYMHLCVAMCSCVSRPQKTTLMKTMN